MFKCKRCHAPDDLNEIGLCRHCMKNIKDDIKKNKNRLDQIYNQFPEKLEKMTEEEKAEYLKETEDIFHVMENFRHMGLPMGNYIMLVRKILYFLDAHNSITRILKIRRWRHVGVTVVCCVALVLTLTFMFSAIKNNPINTLGEAVSVSSPIDSSDVAEEPEPQPVPENKSPAAGTSNKTPVIMAPPMAGSVMIIN